MSISIIAEPQSATVVEWSNLTLTTEITTGSQDSASFQWQKDGEDIVGETNNTLTFSPTLANDAASYQVLVYSQSFDGLTSSLGLTSSVAVVQVGPVVTIDPTAVQLVEGQPPVTFMTTISSSIDITSAQWYRGAILLPGQTTSSITINTSPYSAVVGEYALVVATDSGSSTAFASLNLIPLSAAAVGGICPPPLLWYGNAWHNQW